MTYDDERVVTLLKEAAPERVPDVPDRIGAVHRLARRQRRAVQTQALGAAASIVLLIAAVAAVTRPSGGREVAPVADPARTMVAAFLAQETVHYEIGVDDEPEVTRGALRLDGAASYEVRRNGWEERVLGDVQYRPARAGEELPPGKRWVRENEFSFPFSHRLVLLVMQMPEDVRDVRFVRTTTVRGVPVAEYALTLRKGTDVVPLAEEGAPATLALDAEGLPRRLTATGGYGHDRFEFRYEFFGYGEPVVVEHPPASEFVSRDDGRRPVAALRLEVCVVGGPSVSRDVVETCVRTYERTVGDATCTVTWVSKEEWSYRCSDGTEGAA